MYTFAGVCPVQPPEEIKGRLAGELGQGLKFKREEGVLDKFNGKHASLSRKPAFFHEGSPH